MSDRLKITLEDTRPKGFDTGASNISAGKIPEILEPVENPGLKTPGMNIKNWFTVLKNAVINKAQGIMRGESFGVPNWITLLISLLGILSIIFFGK